MAISDVELGTWKSGTKGEILTAQTVTTGIAVALSNTAAKKGYLAFLVPETYRTTLTEMLRAALGDEGAPESVLMWYGGGVLLPEHDRDADKINPNTLRFRQLVLQALEGRGFTLVGGAWLPIDKMLNVALRSGTNRCALVTKHEPS